MIFAIVMALIIFFWVIPAVIGILASLIEWISETQLGCVGTIAIILITIFIIAICNL